MRYSETCTVRTKRQQKRNGFRRRLFQLFLAGVLAAASGNAALPVEIYAEEEEGKIYAKRSFDESYDTQNAYDGDDLGCTYTSEKTTFKVWSPEASSVVLCRYENGSGGSAIEETPMAKGEKGVWSVEIAGDIVNTYYTYKVTVDGTTQEAADIYAKAAGVNGDRAMVVDLDSTDPENWEKDYQREETLLSDIIVWEVHIRDFSIDASSGVSQPNRGKYKAFTENTTINGEGNTASCVDYLKELGVTHVQILPMYDYASVDEENDSTSLGSAYSWGYDPKNYNVPEGSYSSNPQDGNVRITEMKEMIQALHDAGIKVIMDVAYSHTCDARNSNFNKIMPDYYYKLNSDLSYNDQSGWGNATRSESAMFRKFMIDSLSFWAEEYNLDGFRFDLMGIHDLTTMNQIRRALDGRFGKNTIVLYGEGWSGNGTYDSSSAHKANESKLDYGIGFYNEQIREALKGGQNFDGTIGFLQTNYVSGEYLEPGEKWPDNVFAGMMGSAGYTTGEFGMWRPFWSKSSGCCLSYASSHDNLTLWDKLAEGFGKDFSSVDDKMKRMNKLAGSVVLVSKGGVFMQAGEEFARTKNGDENSGSSPDSVNKIDWNRVDTYSDIQEYYRGMIRIRKAFSGFRSVLQRNSNDNWNPVNNNIEWISKEEAGMTAFYETNDVPGQWDRIAVLINNAVSEETVTLTGASDWAVIADGTKAGLEKIRESGSDITVPGKSVLVAVPKDTFDENNVSDNKPPVITCGTSFRVLAGQAFSFTVEASDPEKDTVTLAADGIPNGASFDAAAGVFQWENPAAGQYTVTLTASDGRNTAAKTVTITVSEESGENPEEPDKDPIKPGEGSEEPDKDPIKPGEGSEEPDKDPVKPGEGSEEPDKDPIKSGEGSEEPDKDPVKPGEGSEEPDKDPIKPGEGSEEPDKDPEEPGKPEEEPAKELKITKLAIGKGSGKQQAGDTISISVQSTGGAGVVKYRFLVKKGSVTTIKNYSTSRSAKWKPKKAGKYSIMVYAKDSEGKIAKKTISKYTVNDKLKVSSFRASPSKSARAGRKVKLTAKAQGGTKKYQYMFGYKKSGTNKIKKISSYSSKRIVSWRPKSPGRYTLYVCVKDKTTKRVSKKASLKYVVVKK